MKKDLAKLFKVARERGWTVTRTPRGHFQMRHPNGALVYTGSTPSDGRTLRNVRADLRRAEAPQ